MTIPAEARSMLVLALDTSTRQGSAALVRDGTLLEQFEGDPARSHGERLPGDVLALLGRHRLALADVDLFAVAAGPGSFTGLRVGIATMQGLAFATGRPIVGVPVLDVLGQAAAGWDGFQIVGPRAEGEVVAVVLDAQRREVFAALYRVLVPAHLARGGLGVEQPQPATLALLDGPVALPSEQLPARWDALGAACRPSVLIGDGPALDLKEADPGPTALSVRQRPALAPLVAATAEREAAAGRAGGPAHIRPVYVRRSDAELARERTAAAERSRPDDAGCQPGGTE